MTDVLSCWPVVFSVAVFHGDFRNHILICLDWLGHKAVQLNSPFFAIYRNLAFGGLSI